MNLSMGSPPIAGVPSRSALPGKTGPSTAAAFEAAVQNMAAATAAVPRAAFVSEGGPVGQAEAMPAGAEPMQKLEEGNPSFERPARGLAGWHFGIHEKVPATMAGSNAELPGAAATPGPVPASADNAADIPASGEEQIPAVAPIAAVPEPVTAGSDPAGNAGTGRPAGAGLQPGTASDAPRLLAEQQPAPASAAKPTGSAVPAGTGTAPQPGAVPALDNPALPATAPVIVPLPAPVLPPVAAPVIVPLPAPVLPPVAIPHTVRGTAQVAPVPAATLLPGIEVTASDASAVHPPVVVPAPAAAVPAAAPTAGLTAGSTPPAQLLTQVSQPLVRLAGAAPGEHVITLSVNPESLGPVTVRALISSDGVRVEIFAPTDTGREALRHILADLRRDLAGIGTGAAATLTLSDQNSPGNGSGGSAAETEDFGRPRAAPADDAADASAAHPRPAETAPQRSGYTGTTPALDVMA